MELTEKIESINQQLADKYGIDTISTLPIWRVVWVDDQFENRYDTYTDYSSEGLFIREVKEVRLVRRYNYIKHKYILERLAIVPDVNKAELLGKKISYEGLFTFEDKQGNPLPPKMEICEFVADLVIAATNRSPSFLAKYADPDCNEQAEIQNRADRVKRIQDELFGDETAVGDALSYGHAVSVDGLRDSKG